MTTLLPPITIGIPFYNAESTLLDAVRSVFAQTHQDWELILQDDGSTDKSLELARSIKDPRVKVYSDGQNRQLAARLNEISGLASHDYIARMDADDLMSPERIERQLKVLVSNPKLDMVSTGICSLTDSHEPVGVRGVPCSHIISARSLLLGGSGIVHASLLGKRAWFLRNSYREDMRTGQDANLWVRAFGKDDLVVGFISDPLYYYREDGNVVIKKLIAAYRQLLRTISEDAGPIFSSRDKVQCYFILIIKIIGVIVLDKTGLLRLLRRKRNKNSLTHQEKIRIKKNIEYVRSAQLPI